MTVMALELAKQLFRRPFTNPFPVRYAPNSVTRLLEAVSEGRARINPPVPVPPDYRGALAYDAERCTGCRLCLRVCPTRAIEYQAEPKKIKVYLARCIACGQCAEICSRQALSLTPEFLLAAEDKYAPSLVRG
ncbi:MAG: 4Fe-4S dicluster domain-containing protein [Moorellales bacterium]